MPRRSSSHQHDPDEQLEPPQQKAVEVWNGWLIFKRAPITLTIATGASFLTFLFTTLGFRVTGTPADIKALDAKVQRNDSITNVRLIRVEQSIASKGDQLRDVRSELRFLSYVVCLQARESRSIAAPEKCESRIRTQGDSTP